MSVVVEFVLKCPERADGQFTMVELVLLIIGAEITLNL
jgi:hypothetical protein